MRLSLVLGGLLTSGCVAPCEAGWACVVMGTGELGFNGDGLPGDQTRLASPTQVTVDPEGRIVVVDYSNMRVRLLDHDGLVTTWVGNGQHAYSEPGLDRRDTPLENPVDARWGPDGLLYVLPQHEGRVVRVNAAEEVERFAGSGVVADGPSGVPALQATMGYTGGMAFAEDGTLYISDATFSRVRRVGLDGTVETILGTGGASLGSTPGFGPEVAVAFPERLVVDDARGRLIVADTANHRVLAVDLTSLQVVTLAGTGTSGPGGEGRAVDQTLSGPVGVEVTPDGTVLIADLDNDVVRAVSPAGEVRTVWGMAGASDPVGRATPDRFPLRRPAGLAWTPEGDLLLAERSGHRVLRWVGAMDAL